MRMTWNAGGWRRKVDLADVATRQAVLVAVNDIALEVAGKADELVPFDTGALSGSQRIEHATSRTLTATVSYGGPAAPYALVQHEDMDYRHAPGRTAKYLERPARDGGRQLDDRIVDLVKRAL